jgi:hypothetical protein
MKPFPLFPMFPTRRWVLPLRVPLPSLLSVGVHTHQPDFLLLVTAVATLFASGDALSANAEAPERSLTAEDTKNAHHPRFLRTHEHHKHKPVINDDGDEERATFNLDKFNKMLTNRIT